MNPEVPPPASSPPAAPAPGRPEAWTDPDPTPTMRLSSDDGEPDTAWQRAMAGGGTTLITVSESPADVLPPQPLFKPPRQQVGRYRIGECIGHGGMASVYRARDPSISRDVAIKFLHPALSEDEEFRARFLAEARAAGGLSHPNIVVVHDVGEVDGRPYMAMEFVDGEPLSEILRMTPKLAVRQAAWIARQLALALDYAHARGVVHRDIKPANIMLLRDGRTIKVMDFGIADIEGDMAVPFERSGALMGTPQYMSPEQSRGEATDGRSDLFSAGVVLYQMLAGDKPFAVRNLREMAERVARESAPPLATRRPEVPPALRRIVERCLAPQPQQRYASGQELVEALDKVIAHLDESEATRPRLVPLHVKWALWMGLVVAAVMTFTGTMVTQRQYAAMMGQAIESGASLTRFIAAQNAAAVLGEEWDAVEVAVEQLMQSRNFEFIAVADQEGVVRAASPTTTEIGQAYRPLQGQDLGTVGGARVVRDVSGAESVLGFELPVTFSDRRIGTLALGVAERPMTQVARLSIGLMVLLAVVTVVAVAVASFFVARRFGRPLREVMSALDEVAAGRFDHRIDQARNDEYGLLFARVDSMAEALERREAQLR